MLARLNAGRHARLDRLAEPLRKAERRAGGRLVGPELEFVAGLHRVRRQLGEIARGDDGIGGAVDRAPRKLLVVVRPRDREAAERKKRLERLLGRLLGVSAGAIEEPAALHEPPRRQRVAPGLPVPAAGVLTHPVHGGSDPLAGSRPGRRAAPKGGTQAA